MAGKIEILSEANFDESIKKGNWIVDYWAEWCTPCKIMAPHFDKASQEVKDVKFAKVDVDGNQELAMRFGVMSIPTTILFKSGEPVEVRSGALRLEDIKKLIKENF